MKVGFDIISDLYLTPEESFNWEGKATSLYCVIAGNISNDLRTIKQTLLHLGKFYQGVFYCLGSLEYETAEDFSSRLREITRLCAPIKNVALLHHHVVIIDSVAVLGINGWYGSKQSDNLLVDAQIEISRHEDIAYLDSSLKRLQKHLDVNRILLVSNSVPSIELFFGQEPEFTKSQIPINVSLVADTEHKVTHWAYGSYDKTVDTTINNINYVNNGYFKRKPYWAKRIEI